MSGSGIHPRVQDAVRAWANASSFERGAKALADARRELPPDLRPQLVSEIAEISAELMVELLAKTQGLDDGAEPVDVEGLSLHPKQAERLGAWLEDQKLTADALGLEPKAWLSALDGGFSRYASKEGGGSASSEAASSPATEAARKFLGEAKGRFEGGVESSSSAKAGLTGLLAARSFPSKNKKKKR